MARTTTQKTPAKKKPVRRKKRPVKKKRTINVAKLVTVMGLLLLLVVSMGAVGYVIFFRTVLV